MPTLSLKQLEQALSKHPDRFGVLAPTGRLANFRIVYEMEPLEVKVTGWSTRGPKKEASGNDWFTFVTQMPLDERMSARIKKAFACLHTLLGKSTAQAMVSHYPDQFSKPGQRETFLKMFPNTFPPITWGPEANLVTLGCNKGVPNRDNLINTGGKVYAIDMVFEFSHVKIAQGVYLNKNVKEVLLYPVQDQSLYEEKPEAPAFFQNFFSGNSDNFSNVE